MTNYTKADATHIDFPVTNREEHFEWWYFDAHFDNGDYFIVMYSLNDTRLHPRQPSVRLNYYPKGKAEIAKTKVYSEADVSTSYEKCEVTLGEEYCKDCGDYYELYTLIDGYGAKLKLSKQNHPFTTEGTPAPMPWTVAVPSGPIEGELYVDGQTVAVKGTGYHDHNWGEKMLRGVIQNWYWGKIHSPDISIDYAVFIGPDGNVASSGAIISDKDTLIMTPEEPHHSPDSVAFNALINDTMFEETMGKTFAKRMTLSGAKGDFNFTAEIDLINLVMIEKNESEKGEDAYRYIAKETLSVTRAGVTKTYQSEGLHEIVYP
ncbi:hypothetical protein EOL70_03745 [Leucothrix sargassi]|nr:hypothetical protein EOL70_03745 [Leucothrix sargassi]